MKTAKIIILIFVIWYLIICLNLFKIRKEEKQKDKILNKLIENQEIYTNERQQNEDYFMYEILSK